MLDLTYLFKRAHQKIDKNVKNIWSDDVIETSKCDSFICYEFLMTIVFCVFRR